MDFIKVMNGFLMVVIAKIKTQTGKWGVVVKFILTFNAHLKREFRSIGRKREAGNRMYEYIGKIDIDIDIDIVIVIVIVIVIDRRVAPYADVSRPFRAGGGWYLEGFECFGILN